MQKFMVTIKDNHGGPVTAGWLQDMLEDTDMEVEVTEIPQPPFPSGMDTNREYVSPEYMGGSLVNYAPFTVWCGRQVWGTPHDIDSGIRHHIDTCEECQRLEEQPQAPMPSPEERPSSEPF